MRSRKRLNEELNIGRVDDGELATVLTLTFPRGAQLQSGEVEYRTVDDEVAITLAYTEGAIRNSFAGPALTEELLEKAASSIKDALLDEEVRRICRWPAFSSGKSVEGSWRYQDEWQIGPAPLVAPRANEISSDHPFLLDFQFRDSANHIIRQQRYRARAADLLLMLNLFSVSPIWSYGSRVRKHWVLVPQEDNSTKTVWAQEGHFIPDLRFIEDTLPDIAMPSIVEFPAQDYYGRNGRVGDTLTLPSGLDQLVRLSDMLSQDDRERFLRSCYWYRTAQTVWHDSQSLHLTSLVNAIESIASRDRVEGDPSDVTARFLSFMSNYAPGSPSKTRLNRLYEARSEITHGERLLHFDQSAVGWGLNQRSAQDREVNQDASMLVKGALLNWLWHSDSSQSTPFVAGNSKRAKPPKPGTKSQVKVILPE